MVDRRTDVAASGTIVAGGIVLCGGKSTRMGLPKAELPFGSEPMLARVVRLLSRAVQPIVVVAAPKQQLPPLPMDVVVARDEREGQGPLEGLLAGLAAIQPHAEAAYATSCDVPLLVPGFVEAMRTKLASYDAAVPVEGPRAHPLAAMYHTRVIPQIQSLLDSGERRMMALLERVNTCRVPVETLREIDPELATLRNVNTPADYLAALATAGFAADTHVLAALRPT